MPTEKPVPPIKINAPGMIIHDFNGTHRYTEIYELPFRPLVASKRSFQRVQIVDFSIGELGNEHGIKFKHGSEAKLFNLAFQNKIGDSLYNLMIGYDPHNSLIITFDHEAILDFAGDQAEVPFRLVVEAEEAAGLQVQNYIIESKVIFKKRVAKLGLEIALHEDAEGKLPYNSGSQVEIGVLRIKNDTPVNYTELLTARLEAKIRFFNTSLTPNLVTFQAPGSAYPSGALELEEGVCNLSLTREDGELNIPILLNLNAIESQQKDVKYVLELKERLTGEIYEQAFIIGAYQAATDPYLTVEDAEKIGDVYTLKMPRIWKSDAYNDLILFDFVIGNKANTAGKGEIIIDALKLYLENAPSSAIELNDGRTWDNLFGIEVDGHGIQKLETFCSYFEPLIIKDGEGPIHFSVFLPHTGIVSITPNEIVKLVFRLEIAFRLEKDKYYVATYDQYTIKSRIELYLREDLGPEWLAIDFGTSAIVAAFGDDRTLGADDLSLLNLTAVLGNIESNKDITLDKEYELIKNLYTSTRTPESEYLLPVAMTMLEEGKEMYSDRLNESMFVLTPQVVDLAFNAHRAVPYLKSLIGVRSLLEVNPNFKSMSYTEKGISKVVTRESPKVIDIVKSAYWVLLKHFILQSSQFKTKRLNKIVISVPNYYTTPYFRELREAINNALPHIEPSNIEFISESDAIAFRYYSIRNIFNKYRKNRLSKNKEEYVLVYDIGAGTIDLTYLCIQENDKKTRLIVLGQMSKNSAGNYFDYIIAKSLEKQLNLEPSLAEKIYIKNYVKDRLKPQIAAHTRHTLPQIDLGDAFFSNLTTISTAELYDALEYAFDENTVGLFTKFFSLFGEDQAQNYKLDTVLITGRSSKFVVLQEKIEDSLRNLTGNPGLFFIKNGDAKDNSSGYIGDKELKTSVALGALHYATLYRNFRSSGVEIERKGIQARYGLLYGSYVNFNPQWKFLELFSPSSGPYNSTPQGLKNYRAASKLVDIVGVSHFKFVKTYEQSPAEAYYDPVSGSYNTDYIWPLFAFSRAELPDHTQIQVEASINEQQEITFRIKDSKGRLLSLIKGDTIYPQETQSDSFIKGMWPFIK